MDGVLKKREDPVYRQAGLDALAKAREKLKDPEVIARHKQVMQARRGKLNQFFGKHHTKKTKTLLSKIIKAQFKAGRKVVNSPETRNKISVSNKLSYASGTRKMGFGGRGKSGWVRCKGRRLFYRSSWERSFLETVNKSTEVGSVTPPNGQFGYTFEGLSHSYFPDFAVVYKDGRSFILEIKNPWTLELPQTQAKLKVAKFFMGRGFIVIPEEIKSLKQLNKFLPRELRLKTTASV